MRPLMKGIGITRIANVTGLDCVGIPVCLAVRPNSRSLSVAQGKGLTVDAAKASALMESIETWHAESLRVPLRRESASVPRREGSVLEPQKLPLKRPGVFDESEPILWLEGWDFVVGRPTYVPEELVNLNSLVWDDARRFAPSSNGLAAGNHLLEALVHGLCEVIERDALCLWNRRVTQTTAS